MTPKVPANLTPLVTEILSVVYELAARFPAAIPLLRRMLVAAVNSTDPVRAMRRAALATGAQLGVEAFVDTLLRRTSRVRDD